MAKGETNLKLNKPLLAVNNFQKALELEPNSIEIRLALGGSRILAGQYEKAVQDLTEVLKIDPDNVTALVARGKAFKELNNVKEAAIDYTRAIELNPKIANAQIFHTLGEAGILEGDFNEAIANFSKAIKMKPKYGLAYANRGVAYRRSGQYSLASKDFTTALTMLKNKSRKLHVQFLLAQTERQKHTSNQKNYVPTRQTDTFGTDDQTKLLKQLW